MAVDEPLPTFDELRQMLEEVNPNHAGEKQPFSWKSIAYTCGMGYKKGKALQASVELLSRDYENVDRDMLKVLQALSPLCRRCSSVTAAPDPVGVCDARESLTKLMQDVKGVAEEWMKWEKKYGKYNCSDVSPPTFDFCSSTENPFDKPLDVIQQIQDCLDQTADVLKSNLADVRANIMKRATGVMKSNADTALFAIAYAVYNVLNAAYSLDRNTKDWAAGRENTERLVEQARQHAEKVIRYIAEAEGGHPPTATQLALLSTRILTTQRALHTICDAVQKKVDSATQRRNDGIFAFGSELLQAFLTGRQGDALAGIVQSPYFARNLHMGAAAGQVVASSIAQWDLHQLDKPLREASVALSYCTQALDATEKLQRLLHPDS